ncbi:MAG: DUF2029 domain-containing protein [Myxococcales bacterium]|nr:DUF2029 domain-containing protein [Myxococcales bacterium]
MFPLGLALGRVVSVAAFAAACAGAWWIVGREGKPRAHQLAAVGLMCAGFVFTYRFYDVARADTLMLALIVWGLGLWRHADARPGRAALAGLLLALAFWTKQTAALFILAAGVAGLYLVFRAARRRRALLALATLVLVIAAIDGGGALVGARATGGWLWTYIYELHQTHAFNHERFTEKSWGMLLHAAPLVVALLALRGGAALTSVARAARARRWPVAADGAVFWGIIAAAALLASALGYSTQWAEANAFMPAVWFGAVFVAVLLPVGRGEPLALALVGLQLGFSLLVEPRYQPIQRDGARAGLSESYAWQDPWRTIPTPAQRRRAASLRAELSAGPPVFALHHPMWPLLAGGDGHVGAMGIHDVPPEHRARVEAAVREQLDRVAYPVLWFEGPPPAWLRGVVRRRYRLERRVRGDDRVRPMTGFMSDAGMVTPYRREQLRYVPRS